MKVESIPITSIDEAVKQLLDLRASEYWSFRGQRKRKWRLGLHKSRITDLDICLKQFRKRCLEFPREDHVDENDQWRSMFYGQHHGLSTRLLDWTTNPLVALYFAVGNIFSGLDDEKHYGAVWALKVNHSDFRAPEEAGDPTQLERWIMINPPPITRRIVRQSGKFSYHPPGDDGLLDDDQVPDRKGEGLFKLIITKRGGSNPTKEIRKQLGIMNVHHASLFPDADGVARFINSEWQDIRLSFRGGA